MRQNDLYPIPGSQKSKKRVGRGNGSGHGTFCGRGIKGQKSRSGVQIQRGFEGGQLPIIKRLPRKRGFFNRNRVAYSPVNLSALNTFVSGTEVNPELLYSAGIIDSLSRPVKVLAGGELTKAVTVKAHKFSEAAKAGIEKAGGKTEEI